MGFKFETIEELGTIRKNSREQIVLRVVDCNGIAALDVRVFAFMKVTDEEPRPTKKGVVLSAAAVRELLPFMTQALPRLTTPDSGNITESEAAAPEPDPDDPF